MVASTRRVELSQIAHIAGKSFRTTRHREFQEGATLGPKQ